LFSHFLVRWTVSLVLKPIPWSCCHKISSRDVFSA
jgi:hypothetical protein